ncbi:condensation domain-containing protein [Streptomyces sp. NPDC088348]|uniref:condensation domain-containing protein n=1 Tax=Streptomyces sp. NPDC088348 TaxID=3365853 RepID=UPI0038048C2D
MTATQQGIWLAEQLSPGVSGYHDTAVLRIDGPLDAEALRLAFGDARAVHEAMRCRVIEVDGEPQQSFDAPAPEWAYTNLGPVAAQTRAARIERLTALTATEPFDLESDPLWRARLIRVGSDEHMLILVFHHLISDGWSHGVLLQTVLSHYAARAQHTTLPPTADTTAYRRWLLARAAGEQASVDSGRAREVAALLSEAPYRAALPGLKGPANDRLAAAVKLPVPDATWTSFDRACRRAGTTRYMGLTGLFGHLLSQTSRSGRAVLASPVAIRDAPGSAHLMGCLINVVPIVLAPLPTADPAAALAAGREAVLTALRYTDVPYRDVARALGPLTTSNDPVTNIGVEEFNAPQEPVRVGDVVVRPMPRGHVRLRHDLALSVARGGASAQLLHPVQAWDVNEVQSLAQNLAELISKAAASVTPE